MGCEVSSFQRVVINLEIIQWNLQEYEYENYVLVRYSVFFSESRVINLGALFLLERYQEGVGCEGFHCIVLFVTPYHN